MTSPASDLAAELSSRQMARDARMATDPPVSEHQRKAMWAAAEGRSNLGIPQSVGKEFVGKDAQDGEVRKGRWGGRVAV